MAKKATPLSTSKSTESSTGEPTKNAPIKDSAYPGEELGYTPLSEGDRTLLFMAMIRTAYDQYLSSGSFAIEYYDPREQRWLDLMGTVTVRSGKLNEEYILQTNGEPVSATAATILKVLEAGGFPMMRLITADSAQSQWTEVLAFGGLLAPSPENPANLLLDFGPLWLLQEANINQHTSGDQPTYEYALAAIPRPRGNHSLYGPLHAAITQVDVLADYRYETHEVILRAKDGSGTEAPPAETMELVNSQLQLQQSTIEGLNRDLTSKDLLLASKDQESALLQDELTATRAELEAVRAVADAATTKSSSVTDVYQQIIEGVNTASKTTTESLDSAYTLGNVSLNIKTFVKEEQDGLKLQLVDAANAGKVTDGVVSDLTIDVVSKDPSAGSAATPEALVAPKVLGLTETATRKRLTQFGLRLKTIYQASSQQIAGQAFRQMPEAGADLKPGDTVTVLFAKNNTQFN